MTMKYLHNRFTREQRLAAKGVGVILMVVGLVFGVALGSEVWHGSASVWDAEGVKRVSLVYKEVPGRFILYAVSRGLLAGICFGVGLMISWAFHRCDTGGDGVHR